MSNLTSHLAYDMAAQNFGRLSIDNEFAKAFLPPIDNRHSLSVHLAEIYSSTGRASDAEALLIPAIPCGDPEVRWRLADLLASQKRYAEAEVHMRAAQSGFEVLLERHLLAFADHGAEFYAGSGIDWRRVLDLARANVANRSTLRAFEQAHDIAVNAGDMEATSQILAESMMRWESAAAFRSSRLAKSHSEEEEGAAA